MYILTTYNSSGIVNETYNISNSLDTDRDSIEKYLKISKSKDLSREYRTEFVSLTSPDQNLYILYSYIDGMILYINNKMSEYNIIDLIDTYQSFVRPSAAFNKSGCICDIKALWIIIDTIKNSISNSGYDLENLKNDATTIFDVVDFNEVINMYLNS